MNRRGSLRWRPFATGVYPLLAPAVAAPRAWDAKLFVSNERGGLTIPDGGTLKTIKTIFIDPAALGVVGNVRVDARPGLRRSRGAAATPGLLRKVAAWFP